VTTATTTVANGIDFLGYIVRREYRLVRRRVVHHCEEQLRGFERLLVRDLPGGIRVWRFDEAVLDRLAAVLASYLGHFRFADTGRLVESLWRRHPWLAQYFALDLEERRLDRRYLVPDGLGSVKRQYRHFQWRFPGDALFFQVGRFMEFYDAGRSEWPARLSLQPMRRNRRDARCGFPLAQTRRHLSALLAQGRAVTIIRERPGASEPILRRWPVLRCALQS